MGLPDSCCFIRHPLCNESLDGKNLSKEIRSRKVKMSLFVSIEKKLASFVLKAEFETGESTLAILGKSGAGKSMTLKCIAGIETPDKGKIILNGRVLFDSEKKINLPPQKRKTGYLFQNYALFPNMTVFENIRCVAKKPEIVPQLIEELRLSSEKNLHPHQISGGQAQRTAIARILASEPELFLLDEPFSALDNNLRLETEALVMQILCEKSLPAILVTHDRGESFRMAKNIAVIEYGNLFPAQERHDFFEKPETLVQCRLSGCPNESRIEKTEGAFFFASDWGIRINAPCLKENAKFVAIRENAFLPVTQMQQENVFEVEILQAIEDTDSFNIVFRQKGNPSKSDSSHLKWKVGKNEWEKIRGMENIYAAINAQNLIFMER